MIMILLVVLASGVVMFCAYQAYTGRICRDCKNRDRGTFDRYKIGWLI
jgi:hypothetical protein